MTTLSDTDQLKSQLTPFQSGKFRLIIEKVKFRPVLTCMFVNRDCRAVLAAKGWGGKLLATQLSIDQDPCRVDERRRIEGKGGVVSAGFWSLGLGLSEQSWGALRG